MSFLKRIDDFTDKELFDRCHRSKRIKMGFNTYANLNYTKGNFSAGLRYEGYMNAMPGYDDRYDGVGIPFRFINYRNDNLEITVGNFYEQFGSGLLLRSWEERQLGINSALKGIRVKFTPLEYLNITAVYGNQIVTPKTDL